MSSTQPAHANVQAPFASSAISGHLDTRTAATEVADCLFDDLGAGGCDLLLIFGSFHHRAAFGHAAEIIRATLQPQATLGVTAEAVIGGGRECEGVAGLSAIALRMPGVKLHTWFSSPDDPIPLRDPIAIRQRIGLNPEFHAAIMFADPFTTPITRLLPALTTCGQEPPTIGDQSTSFSQDATADSPSQSSTLADSGERSASQPVIIIGGMASGSSQPGLNVLVRDDQAGSAGAVGVTISGNVEIDFIVSQGCRPIGKPMVITKCKENVILELGGRKAIQTLREMAAALPEHDKQLLSRGLLIGTVINEYKDRFGRGDFLIRNVMGLDQRVGGIAVGEICRVGQTVQFHVRDAETAAEDLQLLLDAQMLNAPPFGALLFSCNGRGERLFGVPNHDTGVVQERLGEVPLAGFFCAGEFGPLGDRSFLHGHTASLALLRGRPATSPPGA